MNAFGLRRPTARTKGGKLKINQLIRFSFFPILLLILIRQQYPHFKEEMYLQAQRAFGISPDRHYRFLHATAEEKPKVVVLSVIVYEAEGLEAKDANGNYYDGAQYCPIKGFNYDVH